MDGPLKSNIFYVHLHFTLKLLLLHPFWYYNHKLYVYDKKKCTDMRTGICLLLSKKNKYFFYFKYTLIIFLCSGARVLLLFQSYVS